MHKKLLVLAWVMVVGAGAAMAQSSVSPLWTWVYGPDQKDQGNVYGTQGAAAPANTPGARYVAGGHWTDALGQVWLFGGLGITSGVGSGVLADMWKFDTLSRQWTWMSGSSLAAGTVASYNTQGTPSPANMLTQRYSGNMCWKDAAGNFWMLGGQSTGSSYINDFCRYDPAANQWTWISGSGTAVNQPGVYGTQGVPAASNHPGSRAAGIAWTDNQGNFWLFSGYGCGGSATVGYTNDLWKYTPATGQWTWVNGTTQVNMPGVYGTKGVAAPGNIPPGRGGSGAAWVDNAGNLWMFGGINASGALNDMWKYDIAANQWTWMHGAMTGNPYGTYGTLYIPAPANTPGGRYAMSNWKDGDGNFWLFGGHGFTTSGARDFLNDLWKYDVADNQWRWVSGVNTGLGYATYGTQGVPDPANIPGARQSTWSDWVGNDSSFWLFGGQGHVASGTRGFLNDIWRFHISCSVDLGRDTAICAGEQYVLNPGFPGMPRVWNTGATTDTLIVTASGTYWCAMNMPCGWRTDTVQIDVYPRPVVDLGPDIHECEGTPVTLSGATANPGLPHLWNTGDTTATLPVTQPGDYWLQAGRNGCSSADTINVLFDKKLELDLGPDTAFCTRDIPWTLHPGQPPGTQHLWNNGSTQDTLTVTHSGTYWLKVTKDLCVAEDTIRIRVVPTPMINIGGDTIICEQFPLRIGVEVNGASYAWNTGATTSHISVNATAAYILEVNLDGCRVRDTAAITAMPVPDIDLGEDRDICPEQTIVLDATYGSNSRYAWNTGDTTATYAATSAGLYAVKVTSEHKCVGTDSVLLQFYPKPTVSLGRDTTVCEETPLVLRPRQINADSLLWSDGSVGGTLSIRYGGSYIVTGVNKCGTGSDTVEVKQIFCDIMVPNAFTPNGDGKNDVFRVLGNTGRMQGFRLSVYSRWGEQLFYTENKYQGWDGMHKGVNALLGTYVYLLEYSIDGKPYTQKGSFHLLR